MPNSDDSAQTTPDHDDIAESSARRQDQNVLLELCVGGIDDVVLAAEFDLDRIELNCGMSLGGLTPSIGLLQEARMLFRRPIIAMLRPREGGFCYSNAEYAQMLRDAGQMLHNGADGIAVGFLTADGTIDRARCQDFRERFPRVTLVFHRAYDVLQDQRTGLSQLIELGWQRILTSGGHSTALQGASVLCELNQLAAGRIEILPGGGIRPRNLRELVQQTGIHQVHTALAGRGLDHSTQHRPDLRFGGSDTPGENGAYAMVSRQLLKELLPQARLNGQCQTESLLPLQRGEGGPPAGLPQITSCDGCHACCSRTPIPPFQPGEEAALNVPEELLIPIRERIAADQQFELLPCVWLNPTTGLCRHYELRPQACRDFEIGSDLCRLSRWDEGVD